ncbi:MAG: energy transducer TonB [Prolixibacteraceae bacterium]|nr:energy transducer TonB [Prolixibacteraceae bacterium]
MKSLLSTLFILFFIMFSSTAFAQTYEIDSVIKRLDFNEYSNRSRDYFEELMDAIGKFTITIKEGNLAIVSMEKSDRKIILRFNRTANMFRMSQEDYLKVNEFYCNSDIINGINYLEMSVERVSGEISLGEIRFYAEEGLHKPIFTIAFSRINKTNSSNQKSSINVLSANEDNPRQKLVFVDIDHVPNFDYESLNNMENDLSESEISLYETENKAYIEITMNNGNTEKWEFYRIFGDGEIADEFITIQNDSIIPKKMSIKRRLGEISNVQVGYYDKEKQMNGGAFLMIYLTAPKDHVESIERIKINTEPTNNQGEKEIIKTDLKDSDTKTGYNYSLSERSALSLPKPNYPADDEGIIVVQITVDNYGKVTNAIPGVRGSTTYNSQLMDAAKEAALKAQFEIDYTAPDYQQGTITYEFILD